MKQMVSIVGAGALGSSLGKLMDTSIASINYLDKEESKIQYADDLRDKSIDGALIQSDIIFICTHSKVVRTVLDKINDNLKKNAVVVCFAKGIEESTCKTMDVLMQDLLDPQVGKGLMYGSMLATEICKGQPSFAHLAIKSKNDFDKVNCLFNKSNLYLKHYEDTYSIAIAGVLKNIYAKAIGMVAGLGYGNNTKGFMVSLAFKEMKFIINKLGNLSDEVEYSFLSDFITTAYSEDSRNYTVGYTMGKGGERLESEGTRSLPSILKLLGSESGSLLLLLSLDSIVNKQQDPKTIFDRLIPASAR